MDRFNRLLQFYCKLPNFLGGAFSFLCPFLYRFFRIYYCCDIPAQSHIKGVHFCHKGFGVVVNKRARIGKGTIIQHRVTIGSIDDYVPTIGHNVFIGAGAIVIGGIKVGDNSKIGAGALVISDVPENCTVVGVPAKIVNKKNN